MADNSKIEWTDATWNPIVGCEIKSPGCRECYAMRLAGGRMRNHPSRVGLTRQSKVGPVWTGDVRFIEESLDQPSRWTRPRDIFVGAHSDLFYTGVHPIHRRRIMEQIVANPRHRYQILTKRPETAVDFLTEYSPTRNVLIGVSVERQPEADERRESLRLIAALGWRTWVSYEPAIGPVAWRGWEFIQWMVSGGESGRLARPTHPQWHRDTSDWCGENRIPYYFKQWGEFRPDTDGPHVAHAIAEIHLNGTERCTNFGNPEGALMARVGKKAAGAMLDGREWREMPAVVRGE